MIDWESDRTRVRLEELKTFMDLHGRDCRVVRWAFAYRNLRNKIWWQWRRRLLSYLHKGPPKDNRLHVYWHLRGGIGDVAAQRVCVQAWRKKLPNAVFYYYCQYPGAAHIFFEENEKNVFIGGGSKPLWYRHDVAIELCISFRTVHVNHKRVKQVAPEIIPLLQESQRRQDLLGYFVRDNYMSDDVLSRFLNRHQVPRLSALQYLSGIDFDVNETGLLPISLRDPKVLDKYGLTGKKYITIHNGVNNYMPLCGRYPLKCWPIDRWREFVKLFKAAYPDILVVQLGGSWSPAFDFVDMCLANKTKPTEIAALLDNSLLHIDGESGLVHMTRWLRTKAVVFFAHSSPDMEKLDKNRNLIARECEPCMLVIGKEWYARCLCGHKTCRNLDQITPQQVFQAVQEELH